jgi:1-acyl-sn-glycerol-3-phosphate acyltransferase
VRLPPPWVRRAVLDPLWPPVALVLAAVFLVVAAAGALAWPFDRRVRVPRLALLAALYLVLNPALLVACGVLWLMRPVPAWRDDERWQDAHVRVLRRVLTTLRSAAVPLLGFRVVLEEPPDVGRISAGPILVLARHAGPGDSFTLVELLLSRYRRRPRIVLKETLQWDPGLDVILNRLSACFLPARATGADLPGRLADLARTLHGRDAMLIFPEGRNWTPHRYRRALARLHRRAAARRYRLAAADAARHPNVLPPRPAGVLATLAARPDLDVVVIAHTGLEDLVSPELVWQALPLWGRPMTVRWWLDDARSVPTAPAAQEEWLRAQWATVDAWVGASRAAAGRPVDPALADLSAPDPTGPDAAVLDLSDPEMSGPEQPEPGDPLSTAPG